MIIAIDGPAGSGKSTTAKLVAEKLGVSYLDTGSMYRAVTVYFIDNKIDIDKVSVEKIISSLNITISSTKDSYSISLNEQNVNNRLRDIKVSALVSKISANALIREWMVKKQRKIANQGSIVVDGRDIGTVVFPNADYKFFITASIEIRAKRRLEAENQDRDLSMVIEDIRRRDFHDSTRKVSPLKKAEDSIIIDTTHLSINEQVNLILNKINKT